MEPDNRTSGLNKFEGILALLSYLGFCIVAIIGLRKKNSFTHLFFRVIGLFHSIYAKRLCSVCEKVCPVNPTGNFWKTWFKG